MRIEKLVVKNFRQLRDLDLDFTKTIRNDLHIFVGKNGSGKTNIMNVINWCLYGEEPHLSVTSTALPLLNLKTIKDSNENDIHKVIVQLWVRTDSNKSLVFERAESFRVFSGEGKNPRSEEKSFKVTTWDSIGNSEIIENEEADNYVNRFVPSNIREFFFFDGERLDKYFINESGEKINNATFEISQIHLLKIVEDRLKTLTKDFSREAGKSNPKLDEKNDRIDKLETDLMDSRKQIEEIKIQIGKSKEIIKECSEFLEGMPDVESLEKSRSEIKNQLDEKKVTFNEKLQKRKELVSEFSMLVNLEIVISNTLHLIQDKREKNELPPDIDPKLLRKAIEQKFCNACQQSLDSDALSRVNELLSKFTLSTKVASDLMAIETPLEMQKARIKSLKTDIEVITKDIQVIEKELEKSTKDFNDIDKKLGGYQDVETIKNKHNTRKHHEALLETNNQRLGQIQASYDKTKNDLKEANEDRDKELKKDEKYKKLTKKIEFCNEALSVLNNSKIKIMDEIRKKIELETKETFFRLIWKKNTYKDVRIDEKYNINLIHQMGYESFGTASAAERELLALSFTLALHKVSGFDSPIIIDTPVARVSDENRENFAKVLEEVSTFKQTILLFTPDEYSDNVKGVIDSSASNKYKYIPASDELETAIGVI